MNEDHTTNVERLQQHRNATTSETVDRLAKAQQLDAERNGILPAGTRVLDRVTGCDGVVGSTAGASTSRSALVPVRLDRGDLVLRPASQLLVRPTPPRV